MSQNPSGTTIEGRMHLAMKLYEQSHKAKFAHMSLWSILRFAPKWLEFEQNGVARGKKRAVEDADVSFPEVSESTPLERPIGRKAAKRARGPDEDMAGLIAEARRNNDIQEAYVKEKQKAREEKQKDRDLTIMTTSLEGLDEIARRYLVLQREAIMARLEAKK